MTKQLEPEPPLVQPQRGRLKGNSGGSGGEIACSISPRRLCYFRRAKVVTRKRKDVGEEEGAPLLGCGLLPQSPKGDSSLGEGAFWSHPLLQYRTGGKCADKQRYGQRLPPGGSWLRACAETEGECGSRLLNCDTKNTARQPMAVLPPVP